MIETKVYPAGPPREGEWVLRWRTPTMPASAYWYFPTEEEARLVEARMHNHECEICEEGIQKEERIAHG